ncbi:MAG: acyl-CoA dehydrogenase [Gammaproteobacteria bacterium]|nr:acyl-CoA dehydrogenase [Gammaproteobacteria bacterium]
MNDATRGDTPEQAEYRAHCREWLAANHPGQPSVRLPLSALELSDPAAMSYLQDWQKSAYAGGLIGCDYPSEYGGGGRDHCQAIANAEMHRAKTPYLPNIVGMGMAGPTILHHAREDVKAELLPPLLSAEHIWCQGFSEPGAGSDLASQSTFAERDGDNWVVNGHKVWTSLAHFADWMILLCRTDKSDKYNGLSYFVLPIRGNLDKGVTVRPLIKITGETGFNEVLFDNVVVPDRYRLDAVGAGWKVAMTTLTHERGAGALVNPASGGMVLEEESAVNTGSVASLITLAKTQTRGDGTAADDPVVRDELVRLAIREEANRQNTRRALVPALTDHANRIPLQSKVTGTELRQDIAELALSIEGMASTQYVADESAPAGGRFPLAYMNSFGGTIAAGTSEIQRNILGERVLGLAKSK